MTTRRQRLLYRLLTLAALVVGTAVAWYLALQIPDMGAAAQLWGIHLSRRAWTWVGVVAAVLAVLAPVALSVWESRQSAKALLAAAGAVAARQTEMTGALLPVTDAVTKLSLFSSGRAGSGPDIDRERQQLQGSVKVAVLSSLVGLYGGPKNARAVFYKLSGRTGSRQLTPEVHQGRSPIPDRPFKEREDDGREALAALDANDVRQWKRGMPGPPPPGWHGGKTYQGYVSVPVAIYFPGRGHVLHGMLTLDVLDPDTLAFGPKSGPEEPGTRLDGETVGNFARLLAAALTIGANNIQQSQVKPRSSKKRS